MTETPEGNKEKCMRCTSPRSVGFKSDGKTIAWSLKTISIKYPGFQLPCGKCIECRLDYARQWAIRCVHESKMHEKNAFITLTYDDQHLLDPKLDYSDFQKFMKKLRKLQNDPMGVFVTGEYGGKTKRKHWHALIFGWSPSDGVYKYSNDRGDKSFSSETLNKIWGKGIAEYGAVTFQSAGYCARYAAKKLVHGHDDAHELHPISKKSSKHAIGKSWLEKYWPDVFLQGHVVLGDGTTVGIPRYYEKWLKEHRPDDWLRYVTQVKFAKCDSARAKALAEHLEFREMVDARRNGMTYPKTPNQRRNEIAQENLKRLQANLKL